MSTFNVVLKDREISFDSGEDLKEYDLKSILQIDYTDIKTEIAYFPFILNQINFLLIESKGVLNDAKFQLDIIKDNLENYKAKLYGEVRDELIEQGQKNPTITAIDTQISIKPHFKELKESYRMQERKIADLQNQTDYISSLYWNAKAKAEILINLSKSLNINELN